MAKEALRSWTSRIVAVLVVIAAIMTGGYDTLVPRGGRQISGYIDVPPGRGLVSSKNFDDTHTENAPPPQGIVRGSLVDEDGQPVRALEVELIPTDKTGDERWYGTQHAWSNEFGEYEFKQTPVGEYVLGIHVNEAPDGQLPFATTFYPGVDARVDAQRIYVSTQDRVSLQWMRLRRIETTTIALSVQWQDGQTVERGNLLFNNLSYPHSAPVGGYAPQIDNGRGSITLPTGFEYIARAKVDCDAGSKIETIESRPIQRFWVYDNDHPEKLIFIIPSAKCELWKPMA